MYPFLSTKIMKNISEIKHWLDSHSIESYTINKDLTVDVFANVNLSHQNLTSLPFKFGVIVGYFDISGNQLSTLDNCPKEVTGFFNCQDNKLTSLKNGPTQVTGFYDCSLNQITNLKYTPSRVLGLDCSNNQLTDLIESPEAYKFYICSNNKITSLKGMNSPILDDFDCQNNLINSFEFGPQKILNNMDCSNNPIRSFKDMPILVRGDFYILNVPIESLKDFNVESDINTLNHSYYIIEELKQYYQTSDATGVPLTTLFIQKEKLRMIIEKTQLENNINNNPNTMIKKIKI